MPIFSIIIPTFNCAETLPSAIGSVRKQSFKDFEILIVDGQSTDGTLNIIKQETSADDRIKCISEQDKGIYDAMNKGIDMAKGEWLYFLGSDDELYDNQVLEKINYEVAKGGVDIVYGNVMSIRFGGLYDGEFNYEKLFKHNICHQAIFFNKGVFEITDNFDQKFISQADYHHNVKWFLNAKVRNIFVDITVANYADDGFSSKNEDYLFRRKKAGCFLKYGFWTLPLRFKIDLVKCVVSNILMR